MQTETTQSKIRSITQKSQRITLKLQIRSDVQVGYAPLGVIGHMSTWTILYSYVWLMITPSIVTPKEIMTCNAS